MECAAHRERVKARTCGNPVFVKYTKIFFISLIALAFITVVILSLIPNSPLLAAIFNIIEFIQDLPTILSMIILIEVSFYSILIFFF